MLSKRLFITHKHKHIQKGKIGKNEGKIHEVIEEFKVK
jgi:hypothetical protein